MNKVNFNSMKMDCPGCNSRIEFAKGKLDVNIESRGHINVPGLFLLGDSCHNPACKWSKVDSAEPMLLMGTYY